MNFLQNWLDKQMRGLGYAKAADQSLMAPIFAGESSGKQNGLLTGTSNHNHKLQKLAMVQSWVFSDIDILSKMSAESELEVFQEAAGGEAEIPIVGHPFEQLLRSPNPHMGGAFLKMYTQMWLQLRGEAYWMLVPDSTGELVEIWPLPADRVEPIEDGTDFITGYLYKPKGYSSKPILLPVENIYYTRMPNPFSLHRGYSRLNPAALPMQSDNEAARWNMDTFQNDANLRTIISVPSNVSDRIFSKIKSELIDELVTKGRRYVIARGGDLKADSIGLSQKDMEFLNGREFTRDEIDRIFGFPSGFWSSSANRASKDADKATVAQFALMPVLRLMEEDMKSQILNRWYGEGLVCHFSNIAPEDEELNLKKNEQQWQVLTVNEVRMRIGEKPLETAYGDVPYSLREDSATLALTELLDFSVQYARLNADNVVQVNDGPPPEDERPVEETKAIFYWSKPAKDELRKWKSCAVRGAKRGLCKSTWRSDIIPVDVRGLIGDAIAFTTMVATTKEQRIQEIKHLFAHVDDLRQLKAADVTIIGPGEDEDDIITGFIAAFSAIVASMLAGDISSSVAAGQLETAMMLALATAFTVGSGGQDATEALAGMAGIVGDSSDLLTTDIDENDLFSDGDEDSILSRALLWAGAITGMYAFGQTKRVGTLLTWHRGGTVNGCTNCVANDGQTKLAEAWQALNTWPQAKNGSLACGGWKCRCYFEAVI